MGHPVYGVTRLASRHTTHSTDRSALLVCGRRRHMAGLVDKPGRSPPPPPLPPPPPPPPPPPCSCAPRGTSGPGDRGRRMSANGLRLAAASPSASSARRGLRSSLGLSSVGMCAAPPHRGFLRRAPEAARREADAPATITRAREGVSRSRADDRAIASSRRAARMSVPGATRRSWRPPAARRCEAAGPHPGPTDADVSPASTRSSTPRRRVGVPGGCSSSIPRRPPRPK